MTVYTNKDVSEIMGIPSRLVQFYTKEGVIEPVDGGGKRGHPWVYDKSNLIEVGILKQVIVFGMNLRNVKKFLAWWRDHKNWLSRDRRRLIDGETGKPLDSYLYLTYNAETDEVDVLHDWGTHTPLPEGNHDSWITINTGRIIAKVESL
jgi:DNA-binding transcriptional MerR regulator